ncbi:ABC transporter permease [Branchiibius sp. NY16-3462-2]|uniref:ABC transporter permease n=1 Tax=Branchiibius sp. NY16-3462-2 TaxID=1807500 RepID=UPI0025C30B5E|nr:ABC transporter permease [Branchiibius sp. NY16-3462-2]
MPRDPKHAAPTFGQELRNSIDARTVVLMIGVLLLQVAFIWSYVGAFHEPKPKNVPVAVVAPTQQIGDQTVAKLNGIDGSPVKAHVVASEAAARQEIKDVDVSAAFVINPSGTQDTLLVAGGGGTSVVTSMEALFTQATATQQRTVKSVDVVPLQSGDGRGLSGFYLAIGWMVGGYLVASLLGVAKGTRAHNLTRATARVLGLLPYAFLSGLGGALVVDQGLGAITGHFWALVGIGTLVSYAASSVTVAFQSFLGVLGIGVSVLLFVVLGNPSAGGAYQTDVLPTFWRVIGDWLPNGAATEAIRRVVYFDGAGVWPFLLTILVWAIAGIALTFLGTKLLADEEHLSVFLPESEEELDELRRAAAHESDVATAEGAAPTS